MAVTFGRLVLVLCVLLASFAAEAQREARMYRIGVLSPGSGPPGLLDAFVDGLRDLGYVERKTVSIEWRFADGSSERLRAMADELVRLKVDVIFAVNTPAAQAAKKATRTIPIVIARLADPVKTGLVSSLSRPGGNITGLSSVTEEIGAKRLELLKATLPAVTRAAILWNAGNPGHPHVVKGMEIGGPRLGLQLHSIPVRGRSDLEGAFATALRTRAEAVVVMDDVLITTYKSKIVDLAMKDGLPVVANYREFAEAGALMAYAQSIPDEYRRAAHYVDRIARGAKPAELPIEQPTKFLLVINLKAARALGVTIPQSVMLRADEIIE